MWTYVRGWDFWVWFGLFAQFTFFLRFFVQWIATERARKVVIPAAFWWLSLVGGALILLYSMVRRDPVFIAGNSLGFLIYLRNLWFHYRGHHALPRGSLTAPQEEVAE